MKRIIRTGMCLAICAQMTSAAGFPMDAMAYESGTVINGATVQGKITFTGTVPEPKTFELRRYYDREYCATLSDGKGHRLLKEVNVGQDGGLRDVVVIIEGVEKGKPFTVTDAEVEASLCQFMPFVTVVSDKRRVTVFNRDPVSHDIQGYAYNQSGVDIVLHRPALHVSGTTDMVQLVKGRKVFTMQCGMHPYMQNWGYAIDNPYYAVTGPNGTFTIGDLPVGTYRIKAWHPTLGTQEREITVKPQEALMVDFLFEASQPVK
ncbi:MAG: carboxypeptidase regulatory-like domain-containing protein [Nitrospira sp.]|nr:carboxypeptidase regulatory-like domain-containing protein [Nitrospira sp.]MDH4302783.1 carboxypeptidase regulatory-like domain-containing protein [Nitrospira sp.]MDH5192214.1 carboxypeptidase regulatory-like domain-containing protein [Nitrospira sp.]